MFLRDFPEQALNVQSNFFATSLQCFLICYFTPPRLLIMQILYSSLYYYFQSGTFDKFPQTKFCTHGFSQTHVLLTSQTLSFWGGLIIYEVTLYTRTHYLFCDYSVVIKQIIFIDKDTNAMWLSLQKTFCRSEAVIRYKLFRMYCSLNSFQ